MTPGGEEGAAPTAGLRGKTPLGHRRSRGEPGNLRGPAAARRPARLRADFQLLGAKSRAGILRGGRGLRTGRGGAGGSSPHRRYLPFLGRYLPRRQSGTRRSFSASLPRLLPQELNGLEKATCELHLFSLRVDNSIYSVIFRNVYNYGMRHAANCMHFRSEMRVIRASRARGDLCFLS